MKRVVAVLAFGVAVFSMPGISWAQQAAAINPKEMSLSAALAANFEVKGMTYLPIDTVRTQSFIVLVLQKGTTIAVCTGLPGDIENLTDSAMNATNVCEIR